MELLFVRVVHGIICALVTDIVDLGIKLREMTTYNERGIGGNNFCLLFHCTYFR